MLPVHQVSRQAAASAFVAPRARTLDRPIESAETPLAIPLKDEVALIWFFGVGQTAFERSNTGGMLERAELFAHGARPCPRCDAEGILATGEWCGACRGLGSSPFRLRGHSEQRELDAIPGHIAPEGGGYLPDDFALQRYAKMSRRIAQVAERRQSLADALAAFYGDGGTRYEKLDAGRLFALYPLTRAGIEIVRMARARHATHCSGDNEGGRTTLGRLDIVRAEQELQSVNGNAERRELFRVLPMQAAALYRAAVGAWLTTGAGKPGEGTTAGAKAEAWAKEQGL
jgi:hypothetical protein